LLASSSASQPLPDPCHQPRGAGGGFSFSSPTDLAGARGGQVGPALVGLALPLHLSLRFAR
jgi:hypothetical protein